VSRSTVVDIEAGRRDPSLGTLCAVLRATGLDLDLRLVPTDPHDDVLRATIDALDPDRQAELRGNLDLFVKELAAGIGASKPLRRARERSAR
jgi:transcriptional regulator with XRE-family HTH domain